eukprot:UN01719
MDDTNYNNFNHSQFNIITHLLSIMKCLCDGFCIINQDNNTVEQQSHNQRVNTVTVYPSVLKQAMSNPSLLSLPRFIICSKAKTNDEIYELFCTTFF